MSNKKGGFLGAALRIGLSGAGAQAVVFLSLPLLTRLYDAENFGIWAIIQSTALLIGAIATCRYELAVVLPETHADAAAVLGVGVVIASVVSVTSAITMPFLAPLLLGGVSSFELACWAIPILVFLTAANQLALSWSIRTSSFTLYGAVQLILAVMSAAFPIMLAASSDGPSGLVVGTLIATGVVSLGLWGWIGYYLSSEKLWKQFSWQKMKLAAYKYRNYPVYMTPYTLISTIRERFVYFLLANYAGAGKVGCYSMAQRLTNAPNSLAASALRPVFFQRIAAQDDSGQIPYIISRVMSWLTVLVVPPTAFFFFFPEYIISLLFGTGWAESSIYVMILAIAMLPLVLGNWMDRYFDVLSRQRLAFTMELISSVTATGVLAIAFSLGFSAKTAVIFQAVVMAFYFTLWIWVLFRVAKIPLVIFWRTACLVVGSVVISVAVIFVLSHFVDFWGSLTGFMLTWSGGLFISWRKQYFHFMKK